MQASHSVWDRFAMRKERMARDHERSENNSSRTFPFYFFLRGNFLRVWKNYHDSQLHHSKSKWWMAWFSDLLSTCIFKMLTSKELLAAQNLHKTGHSDLSRVTPKQLMTKLRRDTALQSPSSQLHRNAWKTHPSVSRAFQIKSGLYDAGSLWHK